MVTRMPFDEDDLEVMLLLAFQSGVEYASSIEHTDYANEVERVTREYAEQHGFKRKFL